MVIELKNITSQVFRNIFQRKGNAENFEPYFLRFIGVDDIEKYNDYIKTIESKCLEEEGKCIIFDNVIPLSGEMELIQYIYSELGTMNVFNIVNEDICIFDDANVNFKFLNALNYVINIACQTEKFFNDNVRNNFITKLIVWAYTYTKGLKYDEEMNNVCIHYGQIERHEVYFLILLYKMGFDVIYLNPLKEELWNEIDKDLLCQCVKYLKILEVESFKERASKGKAIENVETITKVIERDVQEQLFSNTGMYVPWQFRSGYTKSVMLDTIVEDIFIYWNEPSKLRSGFKVESNTVTVPCFFSKIDGAYNDIFQYQNLVKYCVSSSNNTLTFYDDYFFKNIDFPQDMYQLMFCQLSDGSFDIEEIKKLPIYKFSKYSDDVQNFILKKFNETINKKELFVRELNKEDKLRLLTLVLDLDERIVRLVDNFDFTHLIPKVVIYIEQENCISEYMQMLLVFIHNIGIDIIIFNPSGLFNINNVISKSVMSNFRLETMIYDSKFKALINKKQGILNKLFKK